MAKIIIIGTLAESLINFRGDFIKSLVANGHKVTGLSAECDVETHSRIKALGISFQIYPVQRSGINPFSDIKSFFALRSILYKEKPDIVLAYTIKPIIWGGLAIRSLGMKVQFFALVTGLGLAFQPGGIKKTILTNLVTRLYRLALKKANKVLFQNVDNMQSFLERHIVDSHRCAVVSGSGVNLDRFKKVPLPKGKLTFLTIARLLGDKGLREYAIAAQIINNKYPDTIFNLVGPEDPSPDGIPLSEVKTWQSSGSLQYLGAVNDVRPLIEDCHIYVLPSYHEGLPRTILEAMAMGRSIITTDTPGCRETVVDGENGVLVPVKNAQALANAMERLIQRPEMMTEMGSLSRLLAEERFDVHKVNNQIFAAMGLV